MGRLDQAAAAYEESIARNPDHIGPRLGLASCYAELGREDAARAQAAEVLRINPGFTLVKYADSLTYKDPDHAARSLAALRRAGLPE
jgi:tetratricopeptide (TPR) repeat protein